MICMRRLDCFMTAKERFFAVYTDKIKREGADKLLDYLASPGCDFFTAPMRAVFVSIL